MAGVSGISSLAVYGALDRLEPQRRTLVAKDPTFKKELDTFRARVKDIKSIEAFFKDYRLLKTVLEAYGLESEIDKIGFVKRLLTSDPTDKNSLINRAIDPRYQELAADIRLFLGTDTLKNASFATKVENRLKQIRTEKSLDEQAPGIRVAMRFKAEAAKVKSAYDILGNPILREVILTVTGLPKEIARQTVESQARTVEERVKIDKFSDPKYINSLIRKFLVRHEAEASPAGNSALTLFGAGNLFA